MSYDGTLTPQQIADTERLRDEWMAAALSTTRCDRISCTRAKREYEASRRAS